MTGDEILALSVAFDGGPPPILGDVIIEEDDPDAVPYLEDRVRVERVAGGWQIVCRGSPVDPGTGEPRPHGTPDAFFDTAREAFAWLARWKAQQRAPGQAEGYTRWKERKRPPTPQSKS